MLWEQVQKSTAELGYGWVNGTHASHLISPAVNQLESSPMHATHECSFGMDFLVIVERDAIFIAPLEVPML